MKIVVKRTDRKSIAYSLEPEKLTIIIPQDMASDFQIENILSAMNGSVVCNETMTVEEFRKLVDEWTEKLQIKPRKIQIRRMRSKWASCSPGKSVSFNSLLFGMPKEFVTYVICHELLHFKVPNHNKLFKNLLSAYMPDWHERISRTIGYFLKSKG
ncbi:MAG: M48 family metallopeptidase [Thermoproteota archaeon]